MSGRMRQASERTRAITGRDATGADLFGVGDEPGEPFEADPGHTEDLFPDQIFHRVRVPLRRNLPAKRSR